MVHIPSLASGAGQQSRKSPPVTKLAAKHVDDAGGMDHDDDDDDSSPEDDSGAAVVVAAWLGATRAARARRVAYVSLSSMVDETMRCYSCN